MIFQPSEHLCTIFIHFHSHFRFFGADGTVNISKLVLGQLAVFPTESDTAVQDMAAAAAAHAG